MRIVHVIGHYIAGLGYEENCLPKAQAAMGHEVIVVTSDQLPPDFAHATSPRSTRSGTILGNDTKHPDEVEVVRLPSTPDIAGVNLIFRLRKKLEQYSPDVVHAHGALAPSTIQCLLGQSKLEYALIVDDHSHSRNVQINTAFKKAYVRAVIAAYQHLEGSVALFVPVTPAARVFLEERLGIPSGHIHQGALGADPTVFKPSSTERASCRQALGLSSGDILILTTGKFSHNKSLEALIQSFARISNRHDNVRLMLAGTAQHAYMNHLTHCIQDLDLESKVTVRDLIPHDELPKFYNAADIGVWPGAHSITVLEAMAAGLVCVIPNDELAYQPVVEAGACAGFRSTNPEALAESIESVVTDQELRTALSTRGRALIEQRLSWSLIAGDLIGAYREAVSE